MSAASAFTRVQAQLLDSGWSAGLSVENFDTPAKLARRSAGVEAELLSGNEAVADGRLMVLFDPASAADWSGEYRFVSYAQATIEPEMAQDPVLDEIGWQWFMDALYRHDCDFRNESGTVTVFTSKGFGRLETRSDRAELEIRASWTPVLDERLIITDHLLAWRDLLSMIAGRPIATKNTGMPNLLEHRLAVSWGQ
jgi:hypothetical protein